jgi:hypothetical protein
MAHLVIRIIAIKEMVSKTFLPPVLLILNLLPQPFLSFRCQFQGLSFRLTHLLTCEFHAPHGADSRYRLRFVVAVRNVGVVRFVPIIVGSLDGIVESGVELGLGGAAGIAKMPPTNS